MLALPLFACSTVTYEGSSYELLKGKRLQEAVVDHKFTHAYRDLVITGGCGFEAFYPNGGYRVCGDRVPFRYGSYRVFEDQVCVSIAGNTSCWRLYTNKHGDYLIQSLPTVPGKAAASLSRVILTAFRS